MAVVRARSSPPYALIVFVFLTVIAVGVAIYLSVKLGDAEKTAADAQAKLSEVRTSSDNPTVEALIKSRNMPTQSLLNVAQKQIDALKNVIETGANKSPDEVVLDAHKAMSDAGQAKNDAKMVDAVTTLNDQLKASQTALAGVQQQIKDLQDSSDKMAAANKASTDAAQQGESAIKDQLTAANSTIAQERQLKEEIAKKDQDELTRTKDAAETERRQLVLENSDLKNKITTLQQQIEILRGQIHREAAPSVAIAPAGHIIRTQPGSDECYIDLGRKDRVVVGLTFSVHDARIGIRGKIEDTSAKADTEAAGKGGIEVIHVGETESLCRIEHTVKGQSIQPGDLISNPVYQNSRNRKSHFVVFGDFDLDGDGVATAGERDRVTHMITSWGGVIDDQLSPQTDFLVLGSRPASSAFKGDDQAGGVSDERAKNQKAYDDLVVEAKRSSVPILNVNRFLAMVGYYDTTIVR